MNKTCKLSDVLNLWLVSPYHIPHPESKKSLSTGKNYCTFCKLKSNLKTSLQGSQQKCRIGLFNSWIAGGCTFCRPQTPRPQFTQVPPASPESLPLAEWAVQATWLYPATGDMHPPFWPQHRQTSLSCYGGNSDFPLPCRQQEQSSSHRSPRSNTCLPATSTLRQ